jgi:hypothetical protein
MRRIVLHIDRLVLRGIGRADAAAFTAALEAELQRRVAESATPERLTRAPAARIDAGSIRLAAGAKPASLGRASGRMIARGITR